MRDADLFEQRRNAPPVARGRLVERNVRAIQPRADDLLDAMIPVVTFVFVLTFRADVGDLFFDAVKCLADFPAPSIAARLAAGRCRPYGAGQEFKQLCLARTVAAEEHPTFAGPDAPVNPAQHRPAAT